MTKQSSDWQFQFALEKLLFEQLPGVVLSATDGHTKIDKSNFFQNGDEYISEFVGLVEAICELAILSKTKEQALGLLPEKKEIKLDTDQDNIGGFEEAHRFCIECGQYEFEGELDCMCKGFNDAIDQMKADIEKRME